MLMTLLSLLRRYILILEQLLVFDQPVFSTLTVFVEKNLLYLFLIHTLSRIWKGRERIKYAQIDLIKINFSYFGSVLLLS